MTLARRARERLRANVDARLLLLLFAALCVIVALSGPQAVLPLPVHRYLFVIDITESMNVMDAGEAGARTTRLAFAKDAVARALPRLRCGSEAGLALFAEHRALMLFAPVEVCAHYGVITSMLAGVDWRLAWRGGSQVARGLESSMRAAEALGSDTRLVFISDGHEAPPVDARLRLHLDADAGLAPGMIVGVGGDVLTPIPVLDEDGNVAGFWSADQVQQVDNHSLGRSTSEAGEAMMGVAAGDLERRIASGTEHYSSLRGAYLAELAQEADLDYHRAVAADDLGDILLEHRYAHSQAVTTGLRPLLALIALVALLTAVAAPSWAPRRARRLSRTTSRRLITTGGGYVNASTESRAQPY